MYQAEVAVKVRPEHIRELRARERSSEALWVLAGLGGLAGVLAVFFRIDAWTKGYLTSWLVLGTVGGPHSSPACGGSPGRPESVPRPEGERSPVRGPMMTAAIIGPLTGLRSPCQPRSGRLELYPPERAPAAKGEIHPKSPDLTSVLHPSRIRDGRGPTGAGPGPGAG